MEICEKELANIPEAKTLPGFQDGRPCDYFFVGDDAFRLRHYLMKPFPSRGLTNAERIFNYRLSRARRTVENAFGILANRFRVLHTCICLHPDNTEAVIIAACTLHNVLRSRKLTRSHSLLDSEHPVTHELVQGSWRTDRDFSIGLPVAPGRNCSQHAIKQQIMLKDYVTSTHGSVPWQEKMV